MSLFPDSIIYNGRNYIQESIPQLYRVLHDIEMGGVRDKVIETGEPLPEVHPFFPNQFVPLTEKWQWLWKDINPLMSNMDWRKLLIWKRAFTNNNGFEMEGDPRRDYVNKMDLTSPLPKMESLICGGGVITGVETIYKGERHLQVETLNGNQDPPKAEVVLSKPWLFFHALSVRPDGKVQSFSLTPNPELVPLVAINLPVYFPMSKLKKLPLGSPIPDPYK